MAGAPAPPPCPSDLRLCVQPHLTARWAPPSLGSLPSAPSGGLTGLMDTVCVWGLAGSRWCVEVISGFILATVSQEGEEGVHLFGTCQ